MQEFTLPKKENYFSDINSIPIDIDKVIEWQKENSEENDDMMVVPAVLSVLKQAQVAGSLFFNRNLEFDEILKVANLVCKERQFALAEHMAEKVNTILPEEETEETPESQKTENHD